MLPYISIYIYYCLFTGIPAGYPTIRVNPELQAVEKDRQVRMQCEAVASQAERMGTPTIFWIKDYIPVDLSDRRLSIQNQGDTNNHCFYFRGINRNYFYF